jgi:hypothetical protein
MEGLNFFNSLAPNAELAFSPVILWSVFMLMFIVFVVFSTVIFYHWIKYDWDNINVKKASAGYLSVAALIFIGAIIVITILT